MAVASHPNSLPFGIEEIPISWMCFPKRMSRMNFVKINDVLIEGLQGHMC
ncbi:MAG: hypothetical protein MG2_1247 [uncultured Candidatus Poseidoniales archaeon]|nr:MAG: hypothetical protein MG2_1247 [uncultured Candidatus Poseidoniales archaeon]